MAVTSGFFNSLNGDRKYNAEQMSSLFDGIINDGIFSNIGSAFMVTADNANTINIGIGRAWFDSTWVNNDAILPLTLDGPEVILDRIDAVVIEINKTEAIREGRIVVVKGTPSSSASRPELANADGVYQHPIAYIYRKAEATAITQADITNVIGTSECPYITGILQVQDIDKNVAQWQSQFEIWFNSLEVLLEGDVAANLAGGVMDLDNRFEDLARDRAVYEPLQDSSNDTILDSNGQPVLGSTVFGAQSVAAGTEVSEEIVIDVDPFEVGDILTTAKSTPGSEWLLCDGRPVSREEYPKLSALFPDRPDGRWQYPTVGGITNTNYSIHGIIYANGYYVGIADDRYNSDNNAIAYSTSINGPWTVIVVENLITHIHAVKYVNNYFMLIGQQDNTAVPNYSTKRGASVIRYGTDITNVLNFSRAVLDQTHEEYPDDYIARDIIYHDGKYIAVHGCATRTDPPYDTESKVCYCTTLSENYRSWTNFYIDNSTMDTSTAKQIMFINGKYYIFGHGDYGSDDAKVSTIWRSSTLTGYNSDTNKGEWERIYPFGDSLNSETPLIAKVLIVDGVYLMLTNSTTVILCDDVTAASPVFQTVTLPDRGLAFAKYNEYYVFSSGKKIMFSKDIHGPWSTKDLDLISSSSITRADLLTIDGILHTYVGVRDTKNYAYLDSTKFDLPDLRSDNWTRVFIKALE